MKKNRIFALAGVVALTTLLGACRVSVGVEPIVAVKDGQITSDWELAEEGQYVICENFNTTVNFSAVKDRSADISNVTIYLEGANTDEFDIVRTIPGEELHFDSNGRFTISAIIGKFLAPLTVQDAELGPSSIVIVPNPEDPAAQSGTTLAHFVVKTDSGIVSTYRFPKTGNIELPVWGGCTTN